jgi:multiple sugar transport system permease protein
VARSPAKEAGLMPIVGQTSRNAAFRRNRLLATLALSLFTLYTFAPLAYLLLSATKTEQDLFTTFGFWFGETINIGENLRHTFSFQSGIFRQWLLNSAIYSTVSAIGATLMCSAAGYVFARFRFPGRSILFALILCAVMVPQTALVVPLFLMLTDFGIVDTAWAVILPSLVFPLGVYLMRVYTEQGVPMELIEAARVDGAGELRIFVTVALRLVAPGLVTVLLLSFVATWNNYFLPLVVLRSPDTFPLTVGLANWYQIAQFSNTTEPVYNIVLMGALISVLPIIAAFLLLQRFWESGLTEGGVK